MGSSKKIKPITLNIDKELWEKFKEKTPRSLTLNERLVELIEEDVNQK